MTEPLLFRRRSAVSLRDPSVGLRAEAPKSSPRMTQKTLCPPYRILILAAFDLKSGACLSRYSASLSYASTSLQGGQSSRHAPPCRPPWKIAFLPYDAAAVLSRRAAE